MTDIYDALLNGADTPADNADVVARLRQQKALGQIAQLTGIAGLQRMGPELQSSSDNQADLLYKTREIAQAKKEALEQAATLASEREKDRMALGANASADRALQRENMRELQDERLQAGTEKVTDKAALAGQKVKDNAAVAATSIDNTVAAVDRLLKHPGLNGNYGLEGRVPNYPGGDAAGAKALLDGLVGQEGLQGMSSMRQQGGTFGRTTNIEFQALQNAVAPLQDTRQSSDQVRETLANYKKQLLASKVRLLSAADKDAAVGTGGTTVTQGFLKGSALPLSRGKAAPAAAPVESLADKAKRLGLGS